MSEKYQRDLGQTHLHGACRKMKGRMTKPSGLSGGREIGVDVKYHFYLLFSYAVVSY